MTSSSPSVPPVQHNLTDHRFEVRIGEHLAVAEYELSGDRAIFTHTFVPPELRGRGLAEIVVRAGLEWARAEKRKVDPQCSYVAAFIERHPEFQPLVG
jgi:uncharacterized protein